MSKAPMRAKFDEQEIAISDRQLQARKSQALATRLLALVGVTVLPALLLREHRQESGGCAVLRAAAVLREIRAQEGATVAAGSSS